MSITTGFFFLGGIYNFSWRAFDSIVNIMNVFLAGFIGNESECEKKNQIAREPLRGSRYIITKGSDS